MFVQHMISVLRPKGTVATVMPHGVLFRGGAERDIRKGLLDDDLLDAVIGLAPEPLLRHRHPRLHPRAAREGSEAAGASGQGAVHQRRRRVHGRAGAELSAARARREDRVGVPRVRRHPRIRDRRQPTTSCWPTTSTSTSADTPTTRRHLSRTTSAPTSSAASRSAEVADKSDALRGARVRPDARLRRTRRRLLRLLRRCDVEGGPPEVRRRRSRRHSPGKPS